MITKIRGAVTFSDVLLVCGFAANCYGCSQIVPWLPWFSGGILVMGYALLRSRAVAWLNLKRRNRDAT